MTASRKKWQGIRDYSRSFVSFKIVIIIIFFILYSAITKKIKTNIFFDIMLYLIIITYRSDDGIMGNCSFLKHSIMLHMNNRKKYGIFYNILPREQKMAWYFTSQLFWCFVYWINNRYISLKAMKYLYNILPREQNNGVVFHITVLFLYIAW